MDPKHKGAVAELIASAWLLQHGYEVFRNVSQCGVADMVIWRPGEAPILIEVRKLSIRVAVDGKTCSAIGARTPRGPGIRFLYADIETGRCGFDLQLLVAELGYTLRSPPPLLRFCSVPGCGGKHAGRGFCRLHYDRWKRGLVNGASLIPRPKLGEGNGNLPEPAEHDGCDDGFFAPDRDDHPLHRLTTP